MKKKISIIIDVVLVLIIILLGYIQVSMMISRGKNHGVPSAFGKSFLYVQTDSMDDPENKNCLAPGTGIIIDKVKPESLKVSTPIYNPDELASLTPTGYDDKGDPIYDPVDLEELKPIDYKKDGDIVTFYLETIDMPDTHRLIDKKYDEVTKTYTFQTMGDNPLAHRRGSLVYEEWPERFLIGKVVYHSKGFGTFLSIASPAAGKNAWFFPVMMAVPIFIIAGMYIFDAVKKYRQESKEREAQIQKAIDDAGIDRNDDEAVELFRYKMEFRLDYQEEFEKTKAKMKKQLEEEKKKLRNEK